MPLVDRAVDPSSTRSADPLALLDLDFEPHPRATGHLEALALAVPAADTLVPAVDSAPVAPESADDHVAALRAVPDLLTGPAATRARLGDERDARTPELFQLRDEAPDEAAWHRAVGELVELHLPLARSIANRYRTQHGDHADLVQVACLGLVKAVLRFRPAVGAPFVSFAVPTITGEVRRYFRDHAWDIRPPRHLQELRPDVDRAGQELAQEFGRTPTSVEIAARLNVPLREVLATQRAVTTGLNMHSLEALTDAAPALSLRDTIGGPDPQLELVTDRLALRPLVAALPDRDRRILLLRYVEGFTQRQIAAELGLSQTQVCRLLTRILSDLRERLEDPALID